MLFMNYLFVKRLSVLLIFLLIFDFIQAQIYAPFSTWNHSGISGVYLQPASIADTRFKFDMDLFGFDLTAANNMYELKKKSYNDWFDNFDEYKYSISGIKNYKALISMDVRALNFMVPLSPKSALGFTARARTMINLDGLNPETFELLDNELVDYIGSSYSINDLSLSFNSWAEAGLTYAREIFDLDKHYLKAGFTLKILQPILSSYLYIENVGYQVGDPSKPIDQQTSDDIWVNAKGKIALPSGFNSFDGFSDADDLFNDFNFRKNIGFGFDFGMVYEYRPHYADFVQRGGGKSKWFRYEPSRYLFRIGVSILDVGSMKYNSDWTQEISMQNTGMDVVNNGVIIPEDKFDDFDVLRSALGIQQQPTSYRVALPTAISIQTDWRINRILYLGVNPYFALHQKNGAKPGTHYMTNISVVPRLEMAGFGLSTPLSYNQFNQFNVGLGLQLGPLWLGSNNMFNMLAANNIRELNICMGLKLSLYHVKKNKKGTDNQTIIEGID